MSVVVALIGRVLAKHWQSIVIVGGIILVVSAIYIKGRLDGSEKANTSIERQNTAAGNHADSDRSRFDLCPPGMWDFAARECRRPPPRGWR